MSSNAQNRLAHIVQHLAPASSSLSANPTSAGLGQTKRQYVKQEVRGRVGLIWLNRPDALNALNDLLVTDLANAVAEYEDSGVIGAIIITGEGRAFAAGADIKQMAGKGFYEAISRDPAAWDRITNCKIPIIAAVNGFAFGGGCEIAMLCDIILAAENAKFGQPEIKIGTIPGGGGTQRLTKAVGKSRTMEMVLTGNAFSATEMVQAGLVSRVYPAADLLPAAVKLAEQIASLSLPLVKLCKQSVLASFDSTLTTGMAIERGIFQSTFALNDQKVGMKAFADKKPPQWTHQ